MKIYNVKSIPLNQFIITGKGDSYLWTKASVISDFHSPWAKIGDTHTEFRALWDKEYLYFIFNVLDSSVYIDKTNNNFESINVSDRVELFFRPNSSLNPYYCLEIDSTSRIMDFKAYPNKKFDFNWNWSQKDLIVKSNFNSTGFSVEGKISIYSLSKLNLIHDNKIETGLFRAKYIKKENSLFEPTWLTWVDPNTEVPNFHLSTSFGILKLNP